MSLNKSWFVLPYEVEELTGFDDSNVRFPTALAHKLIESYTKEGDKVLDPFSGFGTTVLTEHFI